MSRNKKGVELSVNTMIIIVITLLVLLVLAFLIMKGTGNWTKGTQCETQGGECITLGTGVTCPSARPVISAYNCQEKGKTCCINIGGLGENAR